MTRFPRRDIQDGRLAWERAYARGAFLNQPIDSEMPRYATQFKARGAKRILDLGCGTGRHTVFLAKNGFDVFGLDIAPSGLCATLQTLSKAGLIAHVTLSDIQQLPFEDAFFDAIISLRVIHHNRLLAIQETVSEMHRVLKPLGLVWVTVPVPQNHPSRNGKEIEPGTYVPINGLEAGLPHHLFTKNELITLFQRFSILELHIHSEGHYSLLAEKSTL